jgi:hypothetical protein
MTRPQTENLNVANIDPVSWAPAGLPEGLQARIFNRDDDNGALSAIIEARQGWRSEQSGFCQADQEFFVLDGALRQGDHILTSGGFSFYPKGTLQPDWEVIETCRIFVMFDAEPVYVTADTALLGAKIEQQVPFLDSWAMDWFNPLNASDPSTAFRPGIFVKILRQDPDTGTSTHLAGLMPGWYMEGVEVHPVREESLIISGDVNIAEVSGKPGYTVTVGGYYSRPAGIPHGPLTSKNGNVGLVHSDGLLGIDYQDNPNATNLIMKHLKNYPWA